jgi:uncharacterized membrane protein
MATHPDDDIPLHKIPATRQLLEELRQNHAIAPDAFADALEMIHPPRNWGLWVSRLLLGIGVTLVLAGIVYFFAYNWAALPAFGKFGLIIAGFAGCALAAAFIGMERVTGQMLATAAGVLAGVFLAVFGQVYQTGADAWTLFAVWSAILIPMALVAACAPIWGVFAVVSNVAAWLYLDQMVLDSRSEEMVILTALALYNTLLLGGRELLEGKVRFLASRWTRLFLLLPALAFAAFQPLEVLLDWHRDIPSHILGCAAVCTALIAGFLVFYRRIKQDMQALAACALAACLLVECAAFRVLREGFGWDDAGLQVLTLGLTSIAIFGAAVVWLRKTAKNMEAA